MRDLLFRINWRRAGLLKGAFALASFGAHAGALSVGAAKVDITPPADAALQMSGYAGRTQGFSSVHDHIYARAIVLSDGKTSAAIMAWELIAIPDAVWKDLAQRISTQLGIPVDHLIVAGTFTAPLQFPAHMKKAGPRPLLTRKERRIWHSKL